MRPEATSPKAPRPAGQSVARLILASAATLLFLLAAALPAHAAVVTERPLLFSFDGADTTAGAFTLPVNIAIDDSCLQHEPPLTGAACEAFDPSNGAIYVLNAAGAFDPPTETAKRVIDKFNPDGTAADFSALGASSLDGSATPKGFFEDLCSGCQYHDLAVDTSAVHPGRIYVSEAFGPAHAFDPQGNYLWTLNPPGFESCGVTVDALGHLWVVKCSASDPQALEFETTGAGPPSPTPIHSFPLRSGGGRSALFPAIDHTGNVFYVARSASACEGSERYVAEVFDSCLTPDPAREATVDQSSSAGHVFTAHDTKFKEFDSSGAAVTGSPFGRDLIGNGESGGGGRGISYDPALDRVYVSNAASKTVKAFGPIASGLVPDVSSQETGEVERFEATAHGTINPLGLPNTYHFEWKQGTGSSWGAAESQPLPWPSIAPPDEADHPVSFPITGLRANTEYQVRLVGTNTGNDLSAYASPPDTFTTLPPELPIVEDLEISVITTESAHLAATIDPQEDQTTWKVLRSAQPGASKADCEALNDSEFKQVKEGTIPSETIGTVPIEADLTGLKPAETNCVRVTATNSNPVPGRADGVFQTLPVPPSEAQTAFVAPRTDTTARLNGWINPEGEADFSYRFELSEDGTNWTLLPERGDDINAREQILVGYDLTGLQPDTTYLYRLALAANHCKPAEPEELCPVPGLPGAVRSFTTRTIAEVTLPDPRGIELVNPPDKGTQNVKPGVGGLYSIDPNSPSGDQMLWSLSSGAPGANTASGDLFLARRTGQTQAAPNGWESKSLIPPPAEQLGKGRFHYEITTATPDFGRFFFQTGEFSVINGWVSEPFYVRIGASGGEEVLGGAGRVSTFSQASEDGNHFVVLDESHQLVDLEAPGKETLLSLMPDGAPSACALHSPPSWPGAEGVDAVGGGVGLSYRSGYSLIARADASRVYFQVQPAGECGGEGEPHGPFALYVRNREANSGAGQTTLIDPGSPGKSPALIRATPDGRQAYYVTYSKCRRWQYEGPSTPPTCKEAEAADKNEDADLYRWEEAKNRSTCLTCQVKDEAGDKIEDASITPQTPVIVSDDFSHIYFTSTRQLVPGEGDPAGDNLYLLSGGVVRFVVAIGGDVLWPENAEASPDGNLLGFSSLEVSTPARQLTADEVAASCPELEEKGKLSKCIELYLYDDRARSLECLSCLRGGLTTHSFRGTLVNSAAKRVGTARSGFALSRDGSTVAFTTAQKLVPQDVNNGTDVYEWRNGQLRLITNGVRQFAEGLSAPVATALDDDGSDLFFAVADPGLTGYEHDELRNLYDARIGGGFPRPNPPAHCSEESCQGPLQPAPARSARSSEIYSGPGNEPPARKRCPKGKVRRHGRCLRKHHRRAHRRAANANQGGAR